MGGISLNIPPVHLIYRRGILSGGGGTMGQVCFTTISSNRACPTVFIALSSVFQFIVLCALLSECSMAGVEWGGGGGIDPEPSTK